MYTKHPQITEGPGQHRSSGEGDVSGPASGPAALLPIYKLIPNVEQTS